MAVMSMTGYGKARQVIDGVEIQVEIKSVNHRYFDFSCRIPRGYTFLEDKLKTVVGKHISRGKIDLYLHISRLEGGSGQITYNAPLLENYLQMFSELKDKYAMRCELSVQDVLRLPEVVCNTQETVDEEQVTKNVLAVLEDALTSYDAMRAKEGERLKADCSSRLDTLISYLGAIQKASPLTLQKYRERLESKIRETLENTTIDESRILTEVALFADKIATDEETVRLESHIAQFHNMLKGAAEPIGKKLDFIVQEMNREVNTTGSKCNSLDITKIVVDAKAEIEKIREQIQNIE